MGDNCCRNTVLTETVVRASTFIHGKPPPNLLKHFVVFVFNRTLSGRDISICEAYSITLCSFPLSCQLIGALTSDLSSIYSLLSPWVPTLRLLYCPLKHVLPEWSSLIVYSFLSQLEWRRHEKCPPKLLSALLYPQITQHCKVWRGSSVNICWTNECPTFISMKYLCVGLCFSVKEREKGKED